MRSFQMKLDLVLLYKPIFLIFFVGREMIFFFKIEAIYNSQYDLKTQIVSLL